MSFRLMAAVGEDGKPGGSQPGKPAGRASQGDAAADGSESPFGRRRSVSMKRGDSFRRRRHDAWLLPATPAWGVVM